MVLELVQPVEVGDDDVLGLQGGWGVGVVVVAALRVAFLPYGPQHVGLLVQEAVVSGVVGCSMSNRVCVWI